MSYEYEPEWTKEFSKIGFGDIVCPTCKQRPDNLDEVCSCINENGYYEPRNIPPKLIFTCSNAECADCDNDFSYKISCIVWAMPEVIKE